VRGVRNNGLEDEGFFNIVRNLSHKLFGMVYSNTIYEKIHVAANTWSWFLTILALWGFFGFVLPLPLMYFAMLYSPLYGYLWGFMWMVIACLLEYREELRREEAMKSSEFTVKPNAIQEYLALVKKDD